MKITVRMDRRAEVFDVLRDELRSLQQTVADLNVTFHSEAAIESARDEGKFRDFVAVADIDHPEREVLDWVAEELVDEFGWLVDIGRG